MNNKLQLVLLALFSTLIFSCSDDDDPKASSGSIEATLGGNATSFSNISADYALGYLSLKAENDNGEELIIRILKKAEVKSYSVTGDFSSQASVSYTPSTDDNAYNNISTATSDNIGTVTITELDTENKTVSGTFSSKVKRFEPTIGLIEITSGTFNKVSYGGNISLPEQKSTFEADVDGSTYAYSTVLAPVISGKINISFIDSENNKTIGIKVAKDITTGEYALADFSPTYTVDTTYYSGSTGTLTVTKHDTDNKIIEGTFTFKAVQAIGTATAEITNAKFSVYY